MPQVDKKYNNYQAHASQERCTKLVFHNILRDSDVQLVSTNAEIVTNMVISVACTTRRKKHLTRKGLWSQDHTKHINFRLVQFICKIPYVASQKKKCEWWFILLTSTIAINTNWDKIPAPQHLITNLVYKLKPNHKKTQYLRARLDTCTDINIMPVSVYKLVCLDPDCKKLAPSSKLHIGTYTTDKNKVIGSCTLFVVHPDTQCLKEVILHVTRHEGSVVFSCVITLELSLIQPCNNLDFIPSSASLISSNVDHPRKDRSQKNEFVSKASQNVCSSKEKPHVVLMTQNVNQCVVYEYQEESSKWECQAHVAPLCDDKNCQSTLCYDKNCQDNHCVHLWPVKPAMTKSSHMWLAKPAILQSNYKKKNEMKQKSMCDDKNCQSTKPAKSVCDDKNCQSTQCVHMWPVKPAMTKSSHMQLAKPAILQSDYKKKTQVKQESVCDDRKCQSTKPAKSVCDDKNSQSTQFIHFWPSKSGMKSTLCVSVEPAML